MAQKSLFGLDAGSDNGANTMIEDAELLRRYAEEHSEVAFAELVQRHFDLVYAAAWRRLGGNAHGAADVSQQVFSALAQQAKSLSRHTVLPAWLYATTRNVAINYIRAELRWKAREQEAHIMHELNATTSTDTAADWERLRPALDAVMDELGQRDREAVLLRFFARRPFADIGRTLGLSEDAARMRVDRALEKLRALLSRRGVTSTGAALGLILANEAASAAPVGLAATVAGSVFAGAAGASSGSASGWAFLTIMNTTKLGVSAGAAALLLASLAGNAYFLARPAAAAIATTTTARKTNQVANVDIAANTARGSTLSLMQPTSGANAANASAASAVSSAQRAALAALRDQLRASGASETSIRAVLEGILQRYYREQLSTDRVARLRRGWWRDGQRTWGTENDMQLPFPDLRLMGEMVAKPLEELLGVDPLVAAADDRRYAFLPAALRQELGRLDRAQIGGWSSSGQPDVDARVEAEVRENNAAVATKREELMAALTPEQRADYEIRLGNFGRDLTAQLDQVGFTDQEFRSVFPIAEGYAKELAALQRSGTLASAKADLERRVVQQLITTFGFDRALDYIWAGTTEYPAYARIARDAGLPRNAAGHVVQLAAETAERAAAIHADATLTVEQKRAGLVALQTEVRPQLDALFPVPTQQRLSPHALAWIQGLNDGQYKPIRPILPGEVRTLSGAASVAVDKPLSVQEHSTIPRLAPARPVGN